MKYFKLVFFIFSFLFPVFRTNAAFPIKVHELAAQAPPRCNNETAAYTVRSESRHNNLKHEEGETRNRNGKSQVGAALLGVFLGAFGIHRFYLGYTWQGIVQAAAWPLLIAGILLISTPPGAIATASVTAYAIVCLAGAFAMYVWRWVDVIRIIADDLKPADGSDYR